METVHIRNRIFQFFVITALMSLCTVGAQATPPPMPVLAEPADRGQTIIEEVSERDSAPLYSRRLWNEAARDWKEASPRATALFSDVWRDLSEPFDDGGAHIGFAIGLALFFWFAAAWGIPRIAARLRPRLPEGRIRRSLTAVLTIVGVTIASWLAVTGILQALSWGGVPESSPATLLSPLSAVVVFAVFVASLGRNVLSGSDASLRLPGIPDEIASSMRHVPWLLAISVVAASWAEILAMRLLPPQSHAARLAAAGVTLFLCAVLASVWSRLGQALRADTGHSTEQRHLFSLRAVVLLGWGLILGSLVATLLGYYTAGNFLIKQTLWGCVVLLFVYLLGMASGDAIDAYLRGDAPAGLLLSRRLGMEPRKIDQFGALTYGAIRLLLLLAALVLLAAPYGLGPEELFGRLQGSATAIAIGQLRLGPADLVKALTVFMVVMLATRLFGGWFSRRYLPTTRLDPGMRTSLTSVASYIGVVIALSMALAAMGVGLDKITWIASALTVGLGFGLQAIVQNFISGLILLAERPVRVGDWVIVGDAEGDVRRINMRATEITTADRTIVLVPNSELITKVVRNRTLTRSEGLVKIVLPLPAATTDIEKALTVARDIVASNDNVLPRPEPAILVDDMRDNKIWINLSVYVEGPRRVSVVRSALLYDLLRRLPEEGIPLA